MSEPDARLATLRAEHRRLEAHVVEAELALAALVRALDGVDLPVTVLPARDWDRAVLAVGYTRAHRDR